VGIEREVFLDPSGSRLGFTPISEGSYHETTWQPASGKALFRSGPPGWLAPLYYRRFEPDTQPATLHWGEMVATLRNFRSATIAGEFARRGECSRVLNAFSLDRLRSDNLHFFSDVGMCVKAICVDERSLACTGGPATAIGA
jgi:hypothetical protein